MEIKKIGLILIIICVIIMGATFIYTNQNTTNNSSAHVNNTTNITKNATLNNTNVTEEPVKEDSSSHESSSSDSKSYVEKWDESQQTDGDWAYTHDQPVKKDKHGNEYKRMYDPETHENYWYNMGKRDWIVD